MKTLKYKKEDGNTIIQMDPVTTICDCSGTDTHVENCAGCEESPVEPFTMASNRALCQEGEAHPTGKESWEDEFYSGGKTWEDNFNGEFLIGYEDIDTSSPQYFMKPPKPETIKKFIKSLINKREAEVREEEREKYGAMCPVCNDYIELTLGSQVGSQNTYYCFGCDAHFALQLLVAKGQEAITRMGGEEVKV